MSNADLAIESYAITILDPHALKVEAASVKGVLGYSQERRILARDKAGYRFTFSQIDRSPYSVVVSTKGGLDIFKSNQFLLTADDNLAVRDLPGIAAWIMGPRRPDLDDAIARLAVLPRVTVELRREQDNSLETINELQNFALDLNALMERYGLQSRQKFEVRKYREYVPKSPEKTAQAPEFVGSKTINGNEPVGTMSFDPSGMFSMVKTSTGWTRIDGGFVLENDAEIRVVMSEKLGWTTLSGRPINSVTTNDGKKIELPPYATVGTMLTIKSGSPPTISRVIPDYVDDQEDPREVGYSR